jgi:hypothetical protein
MYDDGWLHCARRGYADMNSSHFGADIWLAATALKRIHFRLDGACSKDVP